MAGTTRGIEQTPVTMDTKVATTRQTPKVDFGAKVLDTANSVANTVAVAAPLVPGGAIISAAVSGISSLGSGTASGNAGGAGATYGTGGWTNSQQTNTDPTASTTPSTESTSNTFGVPGNSVDLKAFMNNNMQMLQLQMYMQNENQRFTTWSNVLRVRHDTTKNAINNIR